MRVLVLGGYGLIGLAVVRHLVAAGHHVTALGRSVGQARRAHPDVAWRETDIAGLTDPAHWQPLLLGIDAVVNCAGALQDSPRDNLTALQVDAPGALFQACEAASLHRVVQISAVGVSVDASTAFFRTKAQADEALRRSRLSWIILRPGLVIARAAYGGSALIRASASCPFGLPIPGDAGSIQTVDVDDVARAVRMSLDGDVPDRTTYDLVERSPHPLAEIVLAFSSWLGRPPMRVRTVPSWLASPAFRLGDALGFLGWRPPVRTTALRQLQAGVRGDPDAWLAAAGWDPRSLGNTLRAHPAGVQERWFARLWLLKPVVIGALAAFWLASGIIGLVRHDAAAAVLTERGLALETARMAVVLGSVLDIALGLAVLFRRSHRAAASGMIAVTAGYLLAGSVMAPGLWLEPLGPLVKTIPAAILALVAIAIAEER